MISISYPYLETKIVLDTNSPFVLKIENPHEFFKVVNELSEAFYGRNSLFSFWDDDKELKIDNVGELLLNNFEINFSGKKIVNLLYKKLQQIYFNGENIVKFNEINASVGKFLQDLFMSVDLSIDYDELGFEELLKSCCVKPSETYESLLEKIICYINIFVELKNINVFVFVNLKSVFSDEDLAALYRHCALQKVSLLLVESENGRPFLEDERGIIITEDLCEIVANMKK